MNHFELNETQPPLNRPKRSAYLECIRLLARRDYSRVKLSKKLKEKNFPPEEIEDALDTVVNEGYLREESYINARVRGFMHKGWSPLHIQKKLRQEELEVPLDDIQSIFKENNMSSDEQIQWLIAKKLPTELPHNTDYEGRQRLKRKLLNSLANKGHEASRCIDAVNKTIERLKNS